MRLIWNTFLFALWLLSYTLGLASPSVFSPAKREPLPGPAWGQKHANNDYDAGIRSTAAYDTDWLSVTTESLSGPVCAVSPTPDYDSRLVSTIRAAGVPALRRMEAASFLAAERGLPAKLLEGEANTHVYLGMRNGEPVYVGITQDIAARQAQHGERFVLERITTEPVTRNQARAIEQALIERNPQFENKINSISPLRSWYQDAKDWGTKWLENNRH